jgi:acetyl-CoA carboxylase biotin carboxyl carrier protein
MDLSRIKTLIDLVSGSRISELEIVEGDERIRIVNAELKGRAEPKPAMAEVSPAPVVAHPSEDESAPSDPESVTAPMYGILHLAPAPGAEPFVSAGDQVDKGTKLCLIEAMKVFNAVCAHRSGRISDVLAANGQEVDAGQPLFRIA